MTCRLVFCALVAAACATRRSDVVPVIDKTAAWTPIDDTGRVDLVRELESLMLSTYDRDDSLAFETRLVNSSLVDPLVGTARIGVGPDDVVYGLPVDPQVASRWPLVSRGLRTLVKSKRLDVHLSTDSRVEAAWLSDNVSWEVQVCGKTAMIPLRLTALYAHDGYQWYQVFEHLSFGTPAPTQHPLRGARMLDAFTEPALVDFPLGDLGAPLAAVLSGDRARAARFVARARARHAPSDPARPALTFLLGPNFDGEWRGDQDVSRLDLGIRSVQPEDRRVGYVGTNKTVAYWIGNFLADRPMRSGAMARVRLRGTFVFEKRCSQPASGCRPDEWIITQGHLSEAIDDSDLARTIFGSTLRSLSPLRFDCRRPP